MAQKRPPTKRSGRRGGRNQQNQQSNYQPMHGMGPGMNPNGPFGPPMPMPMHAAARPSYFDLVITKDVFDGTKNKTDAVFEREILDRAAILIPPKEARQKLIDFTTKVVNALEEEKSAKSVADVIIEKIYKIGSLCTDTLIKPYNRSDVVVQLSTLPSTENVQALGDRVAANMTNANPLDRPVALPEDYGCRMTSPYAEVCIRITITPENSSKLEPGLHLDEEIMMVNYFAMRHVNFFLAIYDETDQIYEQELKALICVLKDIRFRLPDFQYLSPWALQYLAYFVLTAGPNRQKINLGTAFRRFFECLAAGILHPKASCVIDPTTPSHRIGWDIGHFQMDVLTNAAQKIVRLFATGNDGYRAVLGTVGHQVIHELSTHRFVSSAECLQTDTFKTGCMDRYLGEGNEEEFSENPAETF